MPATNGQSARETDDRPKSEQIGALRRLLPYLRPYRLTILGVAAALLAASGFTLALPIAFRRVIDGFSADNAALIDQYFLALIGVAAALALATAMRFYLVSRLGERVIADPICARRSLTTSQA